MTVTAEPRTLRALLVEDHQLLAQSVSLALGMEGVACVVAGPEHMTTRDTLFALAVEARPDVVLLDLDLGDLGDGSRLVGPLVDLGCRVLVVSASQDHDQICRALENGAVGVVAKNLPFDRLLDTALAAARGEEVLSPAERCQLLAVGRATQPPSSRGRALRAPQPEGVSGARGAHGRQVRRLDRRRVLRVRGDGPQPGADYILYAILDFSVDNYSPVLETIQEEVEAIEAQVYASAMTQAQIQRFYSLCNDLIRLRMRLGRWWKSAAGSNMTTCRWCDQRFSTCFAMSRTTSGRCRSKSIRFAKCSAFAFEASLLVGQAQETAVSKKLTLARDHRGADRDRRHLRHELQTHSGT